MKLLVQIDTAGWGRELAGHLFLILLDAGLKPRWDFGPDGDTGFETVIQWKVDL